MEFQKPWSPITDHSIPQRNSPNLQKTGDSHTLQAVQNTPKATEKPNVWCKQLKTSLQNPTIHMKHYSLTELPNLKTDSAQPNYAWEADYTPPFQLTLQWPELPKWRGNEAKIKTEQTKDYDSRHAVKELSHLSHDFCFVFEDPPKCLGFGLRRLFSGTFLSCISDMSAAFELFWRIWSWCLVISADLTSLITWSRV